MKKITIDKTHPFLLDEWDWEKNSFIGLLPNEITYGSNKEIWWICSKNTSHKWKTKVSNRIRKNRTKISGCPYCNGKRLCRENSFIENRSDLLDEWDWEKNKHIDVQNLFIHSSVCAWWICSKNPEHKWKTLLSNRTSKHNKNGCPFCSKNFSKGHQEVVEYIKTITDQEIDTNNKKIIKNPTTGYPLELDIYFPTINKAIEYNGEYYHSSDEMRHRDKMKQQLCEEKQIKLLTVWENDWKNNQEQIRQTIQEFLL